MKQAVREWLAGMDRGLSSETIVCVMEGIDPLIMLGRWGYRHPLDPADFGRCIRLLAIAPEYKERLHEMKRVSPVWSAYVTHWDELVALYEEELPQERAPKLYDLMHKLAAEAEAVR